MTDINRQELRRLAEAASDGFGAYDTSEAEFEFMSNINPETVLSLLDDLDRMNVTAIRAIRNFGLEIKGRADESRLDEYLSRGIAMLEAERDQLRAEVKALRKDAERYRWLRDSGELEGDTFSSINEWLWGSGDFGDVSAAIDGAMAEEGGAIG